MKTGSAVDAPYFSVVMPTYNQEPALARSIGSVLAQTWTDFELIIVDDGSSDGTSRLLAGLSDARIKVLRQENRGVSAARNRGLASSTGELVVFLDSDDEVVPHWLEVLAAAKSDDVIGMVTCAVRAVSKAGEARIRYPRPYPPAGNIPRHAPASGGVDSYLRINSLAGTFAVRRSLIVAVGGYAESLRYAENSELMLRLIPACIEAGLAVAQVEEPLVTYHWDPAPWQGNERAFRLKREAAEYILRRHDERLKSLHRTGYVNYLGVAAVNAARLGDFGAARRHLLAALMAEPTRWQTYLRLGLAFCPPLGRWWWEGGPNVNSPITGSTI